MEKILTVVIPAYNVEKYLSDTLTSFLDDSVLEDIEVLVVDDGSKDSTPQIAAEYVNRYPQTFRLVPKENGGHGSTINTGISEATGKFFKVVDGDDWVNTEGFAELVRALKSCNSDYVFTNFYEYYEDTKETKPIVYSDIQANTELDFSAVAKKTQLPMHALVIKTAILKENKIRMDEKCFYVDVEYILFPVPYVSTITYFDCFVYMYRLAQSTQSVSVSGYQKHIEDHLRVCYHVLEFAANYQKQNDADPTSVAYINFRAAQLICSQSTIYSSFPWNDKKRIAEFKAFDAKVRELNPEVYAQSAVLSKKLMLLRKTNFRFYKLIQYLSQKANG